MIQTLLEPCDRATYGKRLKEAAEKLGKSKRTVQRLVKKWEKEGLAGLTQTKRADKGSHRINDELEKFIIKTYQDGNKGSKRITPKQVYLKTKIKAQELDIKAPSHMTVYRVLQPLIDKKKQAKSIRSPGWRGTQLSVKTRGGKDFRSNHLNQIGVQLGFVCHLRDRPSEGGIVERPFKTFNTEVFSTLPGYTGSNVQERPEEAEKEACLTLRDLERQIVRYIVDNYNQRLDARMGDQTRFQRWESGLIAAPDVIAVRDLDICLMKQARRRIQRGGNIRFENLMYRGEYLAGYAGETVILRYEPRDITEILIELPSDKLQVEIKRLNKKKVVTLKQVEVLHQWLEGKRQARQLCRVVGESRTGKTIACNSYRLRHKPIQERGKPPIVPVVYIQIPQECGAKDLFKAIIEHLKYQMTKGTVAEIRDRMLRVLKSCGVEMLIIDEADRLKPKTFAEVRDIFDKLSIAVVLVGTDRLDAVIKKDEQVYNRFRACYRFGKLSGNDFVEAVGIWERDILRWPVVSNLTGKRMMKVLGEATGGYIGLLDMVLREAAIRALKKGLSKIDLETLKEVAGEYK